MKASSSSALTSYGMNSTFDGISSNSFHGVYGDINSNEGGGKGSGGIGSSSVNGSGITNENIFRENFANNNNNNNNNEITADITQQLLQLQIQIGQLTQAHQRDVSELKFVISQQNKRFHAMEAAFHAAADDTSAHASRLTKLEDDMAATVDVSRSAHQQVQALCREVY
jgi:hypothetical protein